MAAYRVDARLATLTPRGVRGARQGLEIEKLNWANNPPENPLNLSRKPSAPEIQC